MIDYSEKVEMVVCCVDYGDMLKHTLPLNLEVFDSVHVVTRESDALTLQVCNNNGVTPVITDAWDIKGKKIPAKDIITTNPKVFNKGAGLNAILNTLDNWVCLVDADIIVTRKLKILINQFINRVGYRDLLMGTNRVDCPNPEELKQYIDDRTIKKHWNATRTSPGIGYFQLFNSNSQVLDKNKIYPEHYSYAGGCDISFRNRFSRVVNLIEPVIHLYHGEHKQNWCGRTTTVIW